MTQRGRHRAPSAQKRTIVSVVRSWRVPMRLVSVSTVSLVTAGFFSVGRPSQAEVVHPFVDSVALAQSAIADPNLRDAGRDIRQISVDTRVDFDTVVNEDSSIAKGREFIKTKGAAGLTRTFYKTYYSGGRPVSRFVIATVAVKEPVTQVVLRGTATRAQLAVALEPLAAAARTADGAKAFAQAYILQTYGWDAGQNRCLVKLWTKESHWRYLAQNKSSGAYGIPQALPGSRMKKFGDDWRSNPVTQIKWGAYYIEDRYGTPCIAWATSQRRGWY